MPGPEDTEAKPDPPGLELNVDGKEERRSTDRRGEPRRARSNIRDVEGSSSTYLRCSWGNAGPPPSSSLGPYRPQLQRYAGCSVGDIDRQTEVAVFVRKALDLYLHVHNGVTGGRWMRLTMSAA